MNKYQTAVADVNILVEKVNEVSRLLGILRDLIGGSVPRDVAKNIEELLSRISEFQGSLGGKVDVDSLVEKADAVGIFGVVAANAMARFPMATEDGYKYKDLLYAAGEDLREYSAAHLVKPVGQDQSAFGVGAPQIVRMPPTDEQKVTRLSAQIESMERDFLAMEARLKALGETADKAVARVEDLTVQQAEAMRAELTQQVADLKNGFDNTNTELKQRVGEFDVFREQAKELLSQMTVEVLAGGHMWSAQKEEKQANNFRRSAVALMAVTIGVIGVTAYQATAQSIVWETVLLRVAVSLALVLPTAYLARESAKHRAQAIELRRASLDFAALEPFLKGVHSEEGVKVRAELARRAFFAGGAIDATSSYGLDPQAIILKSIDTIADLAKRKS